MHKKLFFLSLNILMSAFASAQSAREVGVEIMAQLTKDSFMQLSWFQHDSSIRYQVYTKASNNISWDRIADLTGADTLFVDTTYNFGTKKEYRVARTSLRYTGFDGNGYIIAGFGVKAEPFLGRVLMVIEDIYQTTLKKEVGEYIDQIKNEGYEVDTFYVNRNAKDTTVKKWIFNQYSKDKTKNTMVFLLGRVPVPYSGNYRPDGHVDHTGAWPADLYYGAFDIAWNDAVENNTIATDTRNHNIPGDGKYDIYRYNFFGQTFPIQYVNIPVGRVDLTNMPSFGDDTFLIKRYLQKAMLFRTGERKAALRSLVNDEFGYMKSEAYASGGFRNASTLSGRNISMNAYHSEMRNNSYLYSYACGGGTYTSCGTITSTNSFVNDSLLNPFTMLFGSYFGDWDNKDNMLRAPLASKGWGLANMWSGRPYWILHPCGLGAPLASATISTYNTWNIYNAAGFMSTVHVALMGDPTLRLFAVENMQEVNTHVNCDSVTFQWAVNDGVADSMVIEINDSGTWKPFLTLGYQDSMVRFKLSHGKNRFSLRYLKLMASASGTWWQYGARSYKEIEIDTFTPTAPIGNVATYMVCSDDTLHFVDMGNYDSTVTSNWTWGNTTARTYFGDTFSVALNAGNQIVKLHRTSETGCAFNDSASIEVENRIINLSKEIPAAICTNQAFALVDSVDYEDTFASNTWTFLSSENRTKPGDTLWIDHPAKGTEKLTLIHTSGLGCKYPFEWTLNFQEPDQPEIEVLQNPGRIGDSIKIQSKEEASAYFWNGSTAQGSRVYDFVADQSEMKISLMVQDSLGCNSPIADSTMKFVVNSNEKMTLNSRLKIYPNPFNENFKIEISATDGDSEIQILNAQGQMIQTMILNQGIHEIESHKMLPGLYFVRWVDLNGALNSTPILKF